jgi:hypothetical protein
MSIRTLALALSLLAAGGAPAAPAATPRAPETIVRALYAREATPTHVRRIFAADLAEAYRKDTSHPDEVGEIDFDWRYGAQDVKITHLKIYRAPPPPSVVGAAASEPPMTVGASFENFAKPYIVFYRFCRTADQAWRIADVSNNGPDERDPWSLRKLLHLDPDKVRC